MLTPTTAQPAPAGGGVEPSPTPAPSRDPGAAPARSAPPARRPAARRTLLGPLLLFGMLGVFFVLPFAAKRIVNSPAQDLVAHLGGIMEARNALLEGQFPPRVAPTQLDGARYPVLQFYGNFPYTLGALFVLFLKTGPYTAWKIVTAITVALGGFYTYRCALALTRQVWPSIVAGVVFVLAPYVTTDVRARFAFAESVAFCLLPAVVFYSWRAYATPRGAWGSIALGAVSWCLVALSHNVAYLYASALVGLFFVTCAALSPRKSFWRLARVGACYALGLALVAWYVVAQLRVLDSITIAAGMGNPNWSAGFVPLWVLLSPKISISPAAVGTENLGLQIGWPILAGILLGAFQWGAVAARRVRGGRGEHATGAVRGLRGDLQWAILGRLLAAWALAAFIVWSPFDIWAYIPRIFHNAQFTYRVLIFVVVWGSLTAGVALALAFRRRGGMPHRAAWWALVLVAVAAVPYAIWRHGRIDKWAEHVIIKQPNVGGQAVINYRVLLERLDASHAVTAPEDVPVIGMAETRVATRPGKTTVYTANLARPSVVQLPVFYYPHLLDVRVNDEPAAHGHIDGYVALQLPPGPQVVKVRFVGVRWANWMSGAAWLFVLGVGVRRAYPYLRRKWSRSAVGAWVRGQRLGPAIIPIRAAAFGFALVAAPLSVTAIYTPAKKSIYRRGVGRVWASSEVERKLRATKAFDDDHLTAWAAKGGGPAQMTIIRPRPQRVTGIVLETRETGMLEGWHRVGVVLYLGKERVAEQSFTMPEAATQPVHELKLDAPALADKIELRFTDPVTLTLAKERVKPEQVNPGYREIRVLTE